MRRVALAALALACGCGTPPDTDACVGIRDVPIDVGRRGPSGEWLVGEWISPRLHWPALTTFAVRHGLGRPAVSVVNQLASGASTGRGGARRKCRSSSAGLPTVISGLAKRSAM